MNKLILGNSLKELKGLEDNSIDSIVTDPPYELGFMGKKWDNTGIAYNVDLWTECLRVLKPGGHLLAFSGTRTYHRMAVAIEDAGFEVRDMIEWVYGSGFPKSLNIGKSVNQLETNEWSKIGKALDNIDQKSIIEIWKSNSNNVKIVETQSLKNQIIVGQDTLSENFVVLNVVQNSNQENSNLLVSFAEQNLNEVQAINTKINTALQSVEAEIRQLQDNVKSAEQQSQNQNHKSWSIFTAQCNVREWLKENTMVNHKVDEALKTLRGNKKYSNEEIINVLNAVIPSVLKHTILNQSKTFQNLDTNQKMECVSAINVIITEYIMDNLISNTVAILKSKAVDKLQGNERKVTGKSPHFDKYNSDKYVKNNAVEYVGRKTKEEVGYLTKGTSEWEGWGTALKPAHEPICMARKPLAEKTVAENVLKYGTGGINIDESRVETFDSLDGGGTIDKSNYSTVTLTSQPVRGRTGVETGGRFPANLIHDNSDEVRECFPESNSGNGKANTYEKFGGQWGKGKQIRNEDYGDSGNASRFFKSIIYQAKASGTERNQGLDKLVLVDIMEVLNNNTTLCEKSLIKEVKLAQLLVGMEQSGFTVTAVSGTQNKSVTEWSIGLFGKDTTEKYQEDYKSIILMETHSIMPLKIYKWLIHLLTNGYIQDVSLETTTGGNLVGSAENYSELTITISEKMALALGVKNAQSPTRLKISVKKGKSGHPTVKPIALMEYLIKMVTPKGGIVLDPFMGSGSTGVAAKKNGYDFIGIDMTPEYIEIAKARINHYEDPSN